MSTESIIRVLVTGANGLLGQKLVAKLADRASVDLYATGRGDNRNPNKEGYTYHAADLADAAAVAALFAEAEPTVVIHGAAMTQVDACEDNPKDCHKHNVEAVRHIAHECEARNAHLIHVSTDFIFDGEDGPYDERGEPKPLSIYGHSKLAAEEIVQALRCPWAIARTVLVYGVVPDMSRSNIVLWVKKQLEQGNTIKVVNDQVRSPTLAEDLADGLIAIMMRGKTGIWHISGTEIMNVWEIAQQTALFFGLDHTLMVPVSSDTLSQPAKRPPKTGFIILKAQTELGYSPTPFRQGLEVVKQQLEELAD